MQGILVYYHINAREMRLEVALLLIVWRWSSAEAVMGRNDTAPRRDFAREVAEYMQNASSTKRIPVPSSLGLFYNNKLVLLGCWQFRLLLGSYF